MSYRPLVSVIIPNFNHARFLEQRIDSVLNQSYDNFEVIILDDCSTDGSRDIIERYRGDRHVRTIIYNSVNSGSTFRQWAKGFGNASGELVWIAESDDWCRRDFLEKMTDAFASCRDCVLSYSSSVKVDESDRVLSRPRLWRNLNFDGKTFVKRYMSSGNRLFNASAIVFRRDTLKKIDERYLSFRGAGDYLFWCQAAFQGRIVMVNRNLNFYRLSEGNVTNRNFSEGNAAREDMEVLEFIDRKCHLSRFRKNLSFFHHHQMLRDCNFISEDVRRETFSLWRMDHCRCPLLYRLYFTMQKAALYILGWLI